MNAQIAKEGAEAVRIDDGMLAVDEENEPKEDKNEEEIEVCIAHLFHFRLV